MFGPILVEPRVYDDGQVSEDYLRILILYEGKRKDLDTRWDASLPRLMEPAMDEMGLEDIFIVKMFTNKAEWEEYHREAAKRDQI